MKKKAILCVFVTAAILSGCGSTKNNSENANTISAEVTQSENSGTSSESPTTTREPKKKLSKSEKIALEYVETYLNGSDIEAKKKFVSEKVHPDVQAIFQMAESSETPEDKKLKNATVIESGDYTDSEGRKDKIVLIQGEKRSDSKSELIIFIKDDKVGWGYSSTDKNKSAFNKMRKLFKEPVLDTSSSGEHSSSGSEQSAESMLSEIRNFVVADIWNNGFMDIHWFIGSGTSSTGESMDIDFTMEQLEKKMEKKKEYDKYMDNLPSQYESVKGVWVKLSQETDRLYQQLQSTPPKANDENAKLDVGKLSQYLDAFIDEVENLPNS